MSNEHPDFTKGEEWGELKSNIRTMTVTHQAIDKKLEKAFIVLFGNDKEGGIVTQVQLQAQTISWMRKAFWIGIGAIIINTVKSWFF